MTPHSIPSESLHVPLPTPLYRVAFVLSAEALRQTITSYIKSSPLYDLRVCSTAELLRDIPAYNTLKNALGNEIRAVNVQPSSITLQTMARPLHDAIAPMACDLLDVVKETFPEFRTKLRTHCTGDRLPSVTRARPWAKYSDSSITYGSAGERLRPTIIFKVGASEPHVNLISDASQWLLSGREAQLVVLVDIQEDTEALRRHRQTAEFRQRFQELLRESAGQGTMDILGEDDHLDDEVQHLSDSEPEDYLDLRENVFHPDFVGPIEVTLELWTLEQGLPKRRSTHQVIPPLDDTVELKASDLIPEELVDPSDTRAVPFDLCLYRKFLNCGVQDLAFWRALDILRPRKATQEDPELTED